MLFRRMTAEDIDHVVTLSIDAFPHEHEAALRFDRPSLEAELRRPIARLFVTEHEAQVQAFFTGWLVAGELQVLAIGVAPGARQKGIGSLLLGEVLRATALEGMTCATLELRSDNAAARALYARHGFVRVGEREGYYADGCDAILMQLDTHADASRRM